MSQRKVSIPSSDVSVTPNGKKLVQARLPFKTIASSPKVGPVSQATGESRKRKLSTTDDDNRSIKLSKTGAAKENIAKADEVTVLEMVDLVDDDIDMSDNEILSSTALPKQAKKSAKDVDADEKETPMKRSNRKNDSEGTAKVVIKIPSAKKKKVKGRPTAVASKIDENDEDDDVVLIDSEENSLNSDDGNEKDASDKADHDIVLIEDDRSSVLDDNKCSNSKIIDSSTAVPVKEVSNTKAKDSSVTSPGKNENDAATAKGNDIIPEPMETSNDETIAVEEKASSSTAKSVGEESDETNVEEENLLAIANETSSSESESVVDNSEAKMDTDFDKSKVSTPTSSTVEKRTRRSVEAMNTPKTPASKTTDKNALTPKQHQKKLESEQKRLAKEKAKEERERKLQEAKEERERKLQEAKEERERKLQEAKEERERKLQEEKEQRQRERDEKERQRKKERDDKEEQKRKEREDKEEQRRKEKDEREKKKQAEIDAKNEEKRQKEEEKIAKEEAELKKKRKEAEAFTKFFAKKSNKSAESDKMEWEDVEGKLTFMPFRVKPDMRLAPIVRRQLSPTRKSKFDGEVFNSTESRASTDLYIQSLRNGNRVLEIQGKTWPSEENNDVIIIDDLEGATAIEESSAIQKYRAKFFKFEENRRPPYYGTWQKKSSVITPRRPFATDQKFFDYEVDSDDEWEDEEPGESLHGSDDEKDKESDDDYDIDNEFFVPHGHLSDEELANNDEIDDDNSPDTQKAKLKIMQKVFSDEMKKKTEKIKPRLVGLIWQNKDSSQPLGCPNIIWEMLQMRAMIFNGPAIVMPIIQSADKSNTMDENGEAKKGSAVKKRTKLAEEGVPDLLRLIHGNTNSCEFLMREFRAFTAQKNKDDDKFQEFSLTSIRLKIKELAEWKPCPEEGPMMNKCCWYVSNEQRKHYNMESLSIMNDWVYTLTPKSKAKSDSKKAKENEKGNSPPDIPDELPSSAKTPKSKLGNIAKFTKVLSDDDKKKNFSISVQESPLEIPTPTPKPKVDAEPSPKPAKKRVKLLMSVPRGQEIPVQTKNSLISQYLSSANANKKSTDVETLCIDD